MRLVDGTKYKSIVHLQISYVVTTIENVENTIVKNLRDGWKCFTFGKNKEISGVQIKPTLFLSGDNAFLNIILGKEVFNGDWCY